MLADTENKGEVRHWQILKIKERLGVGEVRHWQIPKIKEILGVGRY